MSVMVEIPGRPVPKGRTRLRNGRPYTPKRTRLYEELVAMMARSSGERVSGEVSVEISLMTRRRLTGDVDNYAKAILDGIVKGGLIDDDSELVGLSIRKTRAIAMEEDRVWVRVEQDEW